MIINPQLSKTKLLGIETIDQIQPNGVDLRVAKIFAPEGTVTLDGDTKIHASWLNVGDGYQGVRGKYMFLEENRTYQVEFMEKVEIAEDECGWCFGRSTLMRNGIIVHSCLYDSGYKGKMVAAISVPRGVSLRIKEGERIAQFVVSDAKPIGLYNGTYQEKAE